MPARNPVALIGPSVRWSRFTLGLTAIATVALAVRIAWVIHTWNSFKLGADARMYHVAGQLISSGHGYASAGRWIVLHQLDPGAYHPPGYGTFLAALWAVGIKSYNSHRIAGCVIGAGTVVLIALIGRRLAGPTAGLVAAGIAAVAPSLWILDTLHLSESPAAFLYAALVLLAYRFIDRPSFGRAAALGATAGVAILTRGEALMLVPLLLLPAVFSRRIELAMRDRLRRGAVLSVALIVVVAPWVVRNLVTFDHPVLISTNGGVTLSLASCNGTFYGPLIGWWSAGCVDDPVPHRGEDESDFEYRLRKQGLEYLSKHRARLPVVVAARVGRLWGVFRPAQTNLLNGTYELQSVSVMRAIWLLTWPLLALAAAGAVVLRRRHELVWPMLVLYAVSTLATAAAFAIIRYRVAAEVATPILCGIALDALWRWWRLRARSRADMSWLERQSHETTSGSVSAFGVATPPTGPT